MKKGRPKVANYFIRFCVRYTRKSGKKADKYCLPFLHEADALEKFEELKEIGGLSNLVLLTSRPKDYYERKHEFV